MKKDKTQCANEAASVSSPLWLHSMIKHSLWKEQSLCMFSEEWDVFDKAYYRLVWKVLFYLWLSKARKVLMSRLNIFITRTTYVEKAQCVKHISSSMGHHQCVEGNLGFFISSCISCLIGVITFFTNLDVLKTNLECPCTQRSSPMQYNILKFKEKTFLGLCCRISVNNCAACQQPLLWELLNVTLLSTEMNSSDMETSPLFMPCERPIQWLENIYWMCT